MSDLEKNLAKNPEKSPAARLPFYGVAGVFALALLCVGVVIQLLPAWQAAQADRTRPMFAANGYEFTRTAVILSGERNARLRSEQRPIVIAPAARDFVPEVGLSPLPAGQISPAASRSTPFTNTNSDVNSSAAPSSTRPAPVSSNAPRWITNAHPVNIPTGHARIAIVIDDMGVAADYSQAVIDSLPAAVTLAFLPYGEATKAQSQQAFERGHDIMVHLPMQPHRATANPGPNALYADDVTAQLERKLRLNFKDLKKVSVGVNNHMGSKFTESLSGMRTVLEAVDAEQLFFLDSVTTGNSAVTTARTGLELPVLKRHVFLDHEVTPEFINGALAKTERHALKHGSAIAIGHPYPATTEAIAAWAPTLAAKGISLVPITNLLQTP